MSEEKQGYGEDFADEEEPSLPFLLRSIFRKIDTSGDGVASKLEVLRFVQREFEQIRAVVTATDNKASLCVGGGRGMRRVSATYATARTGI